MMSRYRRSLRVESLEHRTLLAADLTNGLLTVVGTKGDDTIQVQVAAAGPNTGQLQVDINGTLSFFDISQVNAIQILGLNGNDLITVDDSVAIACSIHGGKGNDTIKGGSGDDTIHGDAGNDDVDGSAGDDGLFGDKGNDTIEGGAGDDTADGGNGNDSISGGNDNDELHGGNGNDSVHGDDGEDTLHGDKGNDTLSGDEGNDIAHGDNGNDVVDGGEDDDRLYGENGTDVIQGGGDDDYMDGGNGDDDCHGGEGDDRLKGGSGHDRLDGNEGDDLCDSDQGDDEIEDGEECDLDTEFKAYLSGLGNMSGEAEYELENEGGQIKAKFVVKVEHLAADTTFDVFVNGVLIGQVSTDAAGEGELRLSSDPSNDELPLPAGFPTIETGTTIQVGVSVQGTFGATYDD